MASIGDLFMRVIADMTGFEVEVEKKAVAAGDKAGQTFGQRMAKNAGRAFSTVVGGALALATAQGLKLNQVLNDLQAETGAVGEDWERMSAVVRRENGRTTESVEDIASAVKGMRQDLGLTGDALDLYADRIFDAGLATRKGAAFIVGAVDDIGDAFHLDLDRALGVIDQLIVSQQRFGGSIEDRLTALADLAPALLALNQTEEDGIELLNAAAASGLDVADVIRALRAAATRLDRPFDEWLESVGAIADDQARLAATSEVVGARAALAISTLARALYEASQAGDSFRVTQDEAADAATKMADKIDSGPIRALQLLGEKVGALLADAGSNPIVTGLAAVAGIIEGFAPRLIPKLASGLIGGLKGIGTRIVTFIAGEIVMSSSIATLAGSQVGALTGRAFGFAMAAAIPAGMVLVAAAIGVALAVLIDKLFPGLAKSMADNFFRGVERVKKFVGDMVDNIRRGLDSIGRVIGDVANAFGEAANRIVGVLRPVIDTLITIINLAHEALNTLADNQAFRTALNAGPLGPLANIVLGPPKPTTTAPFIDRSKYVPPGTPPLDNSMYQPPGYAEGAWRTREGLAYLHDDEMVWPEGPADAFRSGAMGGDTYNVNFLNPQLARGVTGPDVARSVRHLQAYGRVLRRRSTTPMAWGRTNA